MDPKNAVELNDLGVQLAKQGRYQPALKHFEQAIKFDPGYEQPKYNLAVTYNNLAKSFVEKGELTIAKGLLFKSIESEILFYPAYSNLLDTLMHLVEWQLEEKYSKQLFNIDNHQIRNKQKAASTPFLNILMYDRPEYNLQVASSWQESLKEKMKKIKNKKQINNNKRIKIGYVSDGFRDFPTGHNLLDVIKNHDKKKFEIILYSHGRDDKSFYRKQFEKLADKFVDIEDWGLQDATDKITEDNVDILVDLKGHTQGGNLEIFSGHPGKVQISWLGFPGTTGADFIDYAIVDRVTVPKGEEKYWSEKLIFMPDSYRPVDTGTPLPKNKSKITKKKYGLPSKGVIFSSFNNAYKIEPVMWEVWMNILKEVPNSTLWLWERFPEASNNLRKHAKSHGVEPKRLVFSKSAPKDEHLARIQLADIALDTRIVNGHTTTAETIRMGVPVVALYGKHFCSRVSASILNACKMNELVTNSLEEYQKLAIDLATDSKKLKKIKTKLNKNLKNTNLVNTKKFTKNLEKAYLKTFKIYKDGKPPKQFKVLGK